MVPVPDDDEGATIEFSGKVLEKLGDNKVTVDIVVEGRRGEGADPRPRHRPAPVTPALADYTTLGLGGRARSFVSAETEAELIDAVRSADAAASPSCSSAAAPTWSSPTRASPARSST